jgi:CheY-like chemotaxis protein
MIINKESHSSISSAHPIDIYIGHRLRTHRKKLGLRQLDLADLLKVSYQQIQKYEHGTTRISVSTLYDISKIMGVEPGYFYEGFNPNIKQHFLPSADDVISLERQPSLNVLLIEDSASDEILTRKAFEVCKAEIKIHSLYDGVEAMKFLRGQNVGAAPFMRPDIILLDLNIPRKQGVEVLKEVKNDRDLRSIPIIILTNSINAKEMQETYKLFASGYISKSFDINRFIRNIVTMVDYWSSTVILPTNF